MVTRLAVMSRLPLHHSRILLPTAIALGVCALGCASDRDNHNLNADRGSGGTQSSPSLDAGARFDAAPVVTPKVDANLPSACKPSQAVLVPRPVQVLLLLDRSSSMTDSPPGSTDSWWTLATGAVNSILKDSEKELDWGLMFFPKGTTSSECCKMPTDDMSPLIEVATGPSHAQAIAKAMAASKPTGEGTPTARALLQAGNHLTSLATAAQKLIVLATDGDPTCANDSICIGNDSKDYARTKEAMAHVYSVLGIPVAVVGIAYPDSSSNLQPNAKQLLLIELAKLGGLPNPTPSQPAYYLAANADQLVSTFQALRQQTISCTFDTTLESPWPNAMKVTVGGADIKRDTTHTDGWDLQDGGSSLTLFGSACATIQKDPGASTQLTLGCPQTGLE